MPDERRVISIDDLIPATWNPKQPIEGRYRKGLQTSIDHFGLRDDIKVWPDPEQPGRYYVLDGNQRLDVLKESGVAEIECRILADLDAEDAKLFTAAFDRNRAEYDEGKLAALADELHSKGRDLIALLIRPDASIVPPPPSIEPAAMSEAREELTASIPLMFQLTREGYELAKLFLNKSKSRLKQQERLLEALHMMSERRMDDMVLEMALRLMGG